MSREELIKLVEEIFDAERFSEKQIDEKLELLSCNVPHPEVSDLIFYEDLSAEEVVDRALAYKIIYL